MKPTLLFFGAVMIGIAGLFSQDQSPPKEDSYEGLVKELLGTVEKVTKVLKTITDRESADAARPLLKKASERMLVLKQKIEDFPKEEKDRLKNVYDPKFQVAVKQLREAAIIAQGVPGGDAAVAELAILKDNREKQKGKDKKKDK